VEEFSATHKIIDILKILGVPKATFYRWRKKHKQQEPTKLERLILQLCEQHRFYYGHRKITAVLRIKHHLRVNRKTVQKIMQKYNLQCQVKVKRKTYINGESNIVVKNILNRDFKASKPNEKWVTDITYLPYGSKMLYLSTIMDLYNNQIVAYKVSEKQDISLVMDTLKEAIEKQLPCEGILLHSDQGSVYTSYTYQEFAKEKGIITSMSRKGNCHDNAVIESFHSSLKSEGFHSLKRASISNSRVVSNVNQYMNYYNQIRIQEKLNYLSPIDFRRQAA
jgi:transposase InsO family protein